MLKKLGRRDKFSKNITLTDEYKAASSFLPILLGDKYDNFETFYLTTLLLGGQRRFISERSISKDIDQVTHVVMNNFKNLADCEFKNEEQLYRDLVVHLSTTFFRVKYRQQYQSSKFELIGDNYPDIYIYTQMSIHPFERLIGTSLNDYEIGLISTYFASQIANSRMNQDPQVLIVSSGSNCVSRFLLTQLVEQCPSINFSGPIYEAGYKQLENIKELVVLTNVNERLDELRPVLRINDIVTSEDLRNIDKFLQLHGVATTASFTTEYKSLMDIISDNATIKNSEALEKGVKQILLNKKNHNKRKERRRQPLLSEVLTTDMIKFSDSQSLDCRQAFELSAQPLLKTGKITHEYIEAILKNVDDNGPYMNIGPEIALAHARPDQGGNQLGMSLLKLDKDIDLVDDKHRIRLIIVLAAVDSTTHLKALSELAQILGSKKDVDLIMKAKNASQIENLILEGEKQ